MTASPQRATASPDLLEQRDFKGQWWSKPGHRSVRLSEVRNLCITALRGAGLNDIDAAFTVDTLLDKDLQGDHLRGIADVPRWVSLFRSGEVEPNPKLKILKETGISGLIAGDAKGFYLSLGRQSMEMCIQKAKREGMAIVGVRKNLGTLAPLFKMAAAEDLIAFGTIQGPPSIAPTGGTQPLIGNNPTGLGIPADTLDPLILDTAFSQTSATPVFSAAAQGLQVAPGLLLDSTGFPTTDPRAFAKPPEQARRGKASQYLASQPGAFVGGGSLLPIGGFKGYALALAFGLLTNVLVGEHPPEDRWDGEWYHKRPSSLLIAIDPSLFCDLAAFERGVDKELRRTVRSRRRTGVDRLYYPGQRSQAMQAKLKRQDRLPLPANVRRNLQRLARECGISSDLRTVPSSSPRKAENT